MSGTELRQAQRRTTAHPEPRPEPMEQPRIPSQRAHLQHPNRPPMHAGHRSRHQGGRPSHLSNRHGHKKSRPVQNGNRPTQPWMTSLLPEPQQMHPGNRPMYMGAQPMQPGTQPLLSGARHLSYPALYPGNQQAQWLPPLLPRIRQMHNPRHSGSRTRNPAGLAKEVKKEGLEQRNTPRAKVAEEEPQPSQLSPPEGSKPCQSVGQQVEDVQQRLDNISKSNSENLGLIQMLVAMQTATHQKIAQDTADMQNDTVSMQQDLLRKVAEIKQDQLLRQQKLMAELQAVREKTLQISLDHVQVSDQEVSLTVETIEPQPGPEVSSHTDRLALIQPMAS